LKRSLLGADNPLVVDKQVAISNDVRLLLENYIQSVEVERNEDYLLNRESIKKKGSYYFQNIAANKSTTYKELISVDKTKNISEFSSKNATTSQVEKEFVFDGALPTLIDFKIEHNRKDGSLVLHLLLGQTSYFSVKALRDNALENFEKINEQITYPALLTLSCLVISADNYIILPRRSEKTDSYVGNFAPTVNGNLDVSSNRDRNDFGVFSPISASKREAIEEINLEIENIEILGLSRIWTKENNGTYILSLVFNSKLNKDEILSNARFADREQGRFERDDGVKDLMPHAYLSLKKYQQATGIEYFV
jgi:hypothetical protein